LDREENQDELEYNDGLGDLLREKEKLEFSWGKTAVVLVTVIILIFLGLTFLFNVGKNIVSETEDTPNIIEDVQSREEKNDELIKLLNQDIAKDESLAQDTKTVEPEVKETLNPVSEQKAAEEETKPESVKKAEQTPAGSYPFKVIAGTFKNKAFAANYVADLKKKGIDAFVVTTKNNDSSLYRVQAGAYQTREAATKQKLMLSKHEIDSYILTVK